MNPLQRLAPAFLAVSLSISATQASEPPMPNLVLVMCDDLGWGDVGFNGGTHIDTPHLDEMAKNSLRFTRFYAQCAVCSPTRASFVTGRHHDRVGIPTANSGHLPKEEFTIYEGLRGKGYRTGHFGKWHMGTLSKEIAESNRGGPKGLKDYSPPWEHGVDVTFATEAKTPTYDAMWKPAAGDAKKDQGDFTTASGKGWHAIPEGAPKALYNTFYWTGEGERVDPESKTLLGDDCKIIMDRAIPFIEESAKSEKRFVAMVWFHTPHLPVVASKEDVAHYEKRATSGFDANYRGCVTAMDRQIGRLRATLRELGVAENTLVTFCSDNGPEGGQDSPGKQGDFRGRKRAVYEGGVRVPGLIEWPAVIKPGVTDFTACTVDYFPTVMELTGIEMPDDRPVDGISLFPAFMDRKTARPKPLAFSFGGKAAWHDGPLKLYRSTPKADWELYDLVTDPSETTNLAKKQPEKAQQMAKAWSKWRESVDRSKAGEDY